MFPMPIYSWDFVGFVSIREHISRAFPFLVRIYFLFSFSIPLFLWGSLFWWGRIVPSLSEFPLVEQKVELEEKFVKKESCYGGLPVTMSLKEWVPRFWSSSTMTARVNVTLTSHTRGGREECAHKLGHLHCRCLIISSSIFFLFLTLLYSLLCGLNSFYLIVIYMV